MNPRALVPLPMRLADKTVLQGDCIVWTGRKTNAGYGTMSIGNRMELVHRVAYEIAHGRIRRSRRSGSQLCVLHRCDNRLCVNIEHLFVGTRGDNNRDTGSKGRMKNQNTGKTHCKRGHALTPDNVYTDVRSNGKVARSCRACAQARRRAYVMSPATREKKRIADALRYQRQLKDREQSEQGISV